MLNIGKHMSVSKGFPAMANNAMKLGCSTFAFFTRNPRGFASKDISDSDVEKFNNIINENKIGPLVAHAPYTLNLCSSDSIMQTVLSEDIAKMEKFPNSYYNFHPGTHKGIGAERAITNITAHLNEALYPKMSTVVLLEVMAGKGTEIGGRFEDIKNVIDGVKLKDKVGVCLDTCHAWDAGYDMQDVDSVLEEFDNIIGLNYLKAIHLNDSKNERGSHKDRHANLGEGKIGLDALTKIINHKTLRDLPFILETPQDDAGHANEIALMRSLYK